MSSSVVIGTEKADSDQQIFRKELWLPGPQPAADLVQLSTIRALKLAQSSPDGRWIAYLRTQKVADAIDADTDDSAESTGGGKGKNEAEVEVRTKVKVR